jgi:hypothetical protein
VGVGPETDLHTATHRIGTFADERHLSRSMVAYNLFRDGLITETTWRGLSEVFDAQWRQSREARKERQRERGGPSYYIVRRHRLGAALLQFVSRNLAEGVLSPTKASRVLGVRPRNVAPLLNTANLLGGRAA